MSEATRNARPLVKISFEYHLGRLKDLLEFLAPKIEEIKELLLENNYEPEIVEILVMGGTAIEKVYRFTPEGEQI